MLASNPQCHVRIGDNEEGFADFVQKSAEVLDSDVGTIECKLDKSGNIVFTRTVIVMSPNNQV